MRILCLASLAAMLSGTAAFAQPATQPTAQEQQHSPLDKGPYTPEATKAYNGGGLILQGAPGAPAPAPQATAPAVTATTPAASQ